MKKRKYPSFQNSLNARSKTPLTDDKDWCKKCGAFIETKWTSGNFPMPYHEHTCSSTPPATAEEGKKCKAKK